MPRHSFFTLKNYLPLLLLVPFCLLLWYGYDNSTHHSDNFPFKIKWERGKDTRAYHFKSEGDSPGNVSETVLPGKLIGYAAEKIMSWDFPLPDQKDITARFKIECPPSGNNVCHSLQFAINDHSPISAASLQKKTNAVIFQLSEILQPGKVNRLTITGDPSLPLPFIKSIEVKNYRASSFTLGLWFMIEKEKPSRDSHEMPGKGIILISAVILFICGWLLMFYYTSTIHKGENRNYPYYLISILPSLFTSLIICSGVHFFHIRIRMPAWLFIEILLAPGLFSWISLITSKPSPAGLSQRPREPFSSDIRHSFLILCAALTGFIIAHHQTPSIGFLSDDHVLHNITRSLSLKDIFRYFKPESCNPIFYRPVITMTFFLDNLAWGARPFGFHLSNLLLHIGNAILLFFLSRRLINPLGAMAGTAFFLLFPLQPEATTWISGRGDCLASFFYLLCLIFYFRYREKGFIISLSLSIISGLLSVMSKESGLTFPIMLLFVELFFFRQKTTTKHTAGLISLLLLIPIYLQIRIHIMGDIGPEYFLFFKENIASNSKHLFIPYAFFGMLLNIIMVPWQIIAYPFNKFVNPFAVTAHGYLIVLAAFVLISIKTRTLWNKVSIFSTLAFSICCIPTSHLLSESSLITLQDTRFLYLPTIFICMFLSSLIFSDKNIEPLVFYQATRTGLAVALVIIMTSALFQNNRSWIEAGKLSENILSSFQKVSKDMKRPAFIFIEGLPHSHKGAFIFISGIGGVGEAFNKASGNLPDFYFQPDKMMFSNYISYLLEILPFKIVTPDMLNQHLLPKALACQGYTMPEWVTDIPGSYDYILKWDTRSKTFIKLK